MKKLLPPRKLLAAATATLLLAAASHGAVIIVNQFGNTISGNVTFARTFTNVTNASAVTNGRVISWSSTAATLTGSGAPTMYGGARIFHGTAANWVGGTNQQQLQNNDPDRIRLGVDTATFTQAQGFLYIDGEDFGGTLGAGQTWSIHDATASLSTRVTSFTNSSARWLVRSGEQFYVANSTITATGPSTLTGQALLDTTWTAFNPVSGLTSTLSSAYDSYVAASDGTVATSQLTDITAFGLYFFSSGATNQNWNNAFDQLQLSAVAVPEPGTVAVLFGLTALGGAVLRRRRNH